MNRPRVGWGKMSMLGQSESDYNFVYELKAKELTITWSSVLLFLIQWENKNVDLISMDSLIFGKQIKTSSDLLCPTILILPHPTPSLFHFYLLSISQSKINFFEAPASGIGNLNFQQLLHRLINLSPCQNKLKFFKLKFPSLTSMMIHMPFLYVQVCSFSVRLTVR